MFEQACVYSLLFGTTGLCDSWIKAPSAVHGVETIDTTRLAALSKVAGRKRYETRHDGVGGEGDTRSEWDKSFHKMAGVSSEDDGVKIVRECRCDGVALDRTVTVPGVLQG